MKRIIEYINNISLKNKLVFLVLVISLIPILTIGIISYNITSKIIIEREVNEKLSTFKVIIEKVNQLWDKKHLVGVKFYLNNDIQMLFNNIDNLKNEELKKLENRVKKLLFEPQYTYGTSSIYLFAKNKNYIITNQFPRSMDINRFIETEWYKNSLKNNKFFFAGNINHVNGDYVIPLVNVIKNMRGNRSIANPLAILIINLKESSLVQTYQNYASKSPGLYYIVNNRNIIISSYNNKEALGKNINKIFNLSSGTLNNDKGYFVKKVDNQLNLFIYNANSRIGWKFISVVPFVSIMEATNDIKRITFFLSIICLIVIFFVSIYLSQKVTAPIEKLIDVMKEAEKGDFDAKFIPHHNDEIGKLANSFNNMLLRLKNQVNKTITIEKEKRKAEFKVLGFQINPHFLYNTLSSIIWLTNSSKKEEVIRLTKALSDFFRISISKGKEIITINNELQHIKSYLDIQKIRYSDEFNVIMDIDNSVMDYYIPKLILQPLVENAIYHGIKNLEENKTGIIKLKIQKEGELIYISIKDNGNSFTERSARDLNQYLQNNFKNCDDFGIGIRNVNDRIKLYYGDKYGLFFKREDNYTIASIVIPARREEESNV